MKHFFFLILVMSTSIAYSQVLRMEVIDLRQVPLADAARILSESSGLNVVASVEAGKTLISLYLTNVDPRAAIEALCRSHNLWFQDDEKSGIIRIHTPAEYQRDLGSFQEELTEVFDLRYPNALDFARTIRELYGNRVRVNLDNSQQDVQSTTELQQRFERFDIVDGRSQGLGGLQALGSGSTSSFASSSGIGGLSSSTQRGQTPASGSYQSLTTRFGGASSLEPQRIKNLTAEEIQLLQASNANLEQRKDEVERLLEERTDIFVTMVQRLNKVIVRTSDARAMKQIKALMTSIDVPTRTVLLEVKVLRVNLNEGYNSSINYLFNDGITQVGFDPGGTTTTGGGLTFGYAKSNFNARLQILEQKGQVREVATPTLLIANNEVSRLFIGEERPLNRSFSGGTVVPSSTNNVVTSGSTDIEFRPVGTTLLITPNINSDQTVTLRLLQENSNINVNGASVLVPNGAGFAQQSVDTVQSRTVSGTVIAKDQIPVVIGGLIDTTLTDTRSQVPVLGDIPLIGALFRSKNKTETRDELVLLIRPHIVDTAEGGTKATKQFLDLNHVSIRDGIRMEDKIRRNLNHQFPVEVPPRAIPVEAPSPSTAHSSK